MSWDKITKVIAGIGGAIAGVFGEWNTMLTILACVMVIDYVTGVTVAIAHKDFSGSLLSFSLWLLLRCSTGYSVQTE